jgi:DtxR family Mn-dependent transcriptional regulator
MFKKLRAAPARHVVPYRGVSLTPAGRRLALRVTRRHRLLEAFLLGTCPTP